MTKSKKKKLIWTTISGILVLVIAVVLFFFTRTSQNNLTVEWPNGKLGELAISNRPQFFILRPGLTFKIDTGSDISTISEKDIALLDSLGFKAKKSFYPVLGRNGVGELELTTERYTVSLPLHSWIVKKDSIGRLHHTCFYNDDNVIHDVDFQVSKTGLSVLGIDFLEKFKVEYQNSKGLLALYFEDPTDYDPCASLHKSMSPARMLTLSNRYYLKATVNDETEDYFIDTGVLKAFVKCPTNKMPETADKKNVESVFSLRGVFKAVPDRAWVKIGNREGATTVLYYDTDEEPNAINPLNISSFDVLLDFPNKQIKFKTPK